MCSLPAFCCCRRRYRSVRRDRLSSASTDWRGDRTTLSIRRSRDLTTLTEQSWPIWDLWSMYHKIRTLDRIDSGYCNESQPFVVVAISVGCPSTRANAGLAGQPGLRGAGRGAERALRRTQSLLCHVGPQRLTSRSGEPASPPMRSASDLPAFVASLKKSSPSVPRGQRSSTWRA